MFTGLIEAVGTVRSMASGRTGARLIVEAPFADALSEGESVSVDGACLTVAMSSRGAFAADAVRTTLERTTLGAKRAGAAVNLERALRLGDRLGGHLVAGHVDAAASILDVRTEGGWRLVTIELRPEVTRYIAPRASVAVDGISLTVSDIDDRSFTVALIPETLERTTAGRWRAGDGVNLEADLLARHIERLLRVGADGEPQGDAATAEGSGITRERLEALGFLKRNGR